MSFIAQFLFFPHFITFPPPARQTNLWWSGKTFYSHTLNGMLTISLAIGVWKWYNFWIISAKSFIHAKYYRHEIHFICDLCIVIIMIRDLHTTYKGRDRHAQKYLICTSFIPITHKLDYACWRHSFPLITKISMPLQSI